ncbi:MAG: hypothetical protein RLZZ156_1645 [Deinococcota bacterium]|jgi:hypothetical protein
MTMLEQALSKKAFAALERLRRERGIRSRAKAIEIALLEIAPDDETDDAVHLSPADAAIFEERMTSMEAGRFLEATEIWLKLKEKREASKA